jgi:hypothetical protein
MNPRPFLLLPFLLLASLSTARAQTLSPMGTPTELQQQIIALNKKPLPDGPPLAIAVMRAVQADAILRNRCRPTNIQLGPLRPVTLDNIVSALIQKGEIENGWLVSATPTNCPSAQPIRLLVVRAADGKSVNAFFSGQGESLTWPSLARDMLQGLSLSFTRKVQAADPQCVPKPADMTATGAQVSERSADLLPEQYGVRFKGSWTEVWSYAACGHQVAIPVSFKADGKGGAYWTIQDTNMLFVP